MRHNSLKISILLLLVFFNACKTEKPNREDHKNSSENSPYLGQNPPGSIPEPFAPGLVTTLNWENDGVFTPDLKEFYFLREVGATEHDKKMEFVVLKYKDNQWQDSIISARVGQPFISSDGKIMHLGKKYKERLTNGAWSEIKPLDSSLYKIPIMRLTASAKGTYVFDAMGEGVLRYSRIIDEKRENPVLFDKNINSGTANAHPFIAPDESYMLWDSRRDNGYGMADIYISFRQKDGSWSQAMNLGDKVNTGASEYGASVTPDGKYLFFNRNVGKVNPTDKYENTDIFWVDAQVIDSLRLEQ
ncbi:hypothetical protein [Algibacter mikhailovii]|uniref:hypothetical protein n=1 Tax=Algibacter mikhailovii TaxID=425498 RepID=UPI00249526BF|nr:hypothetical protein [Algibacter mikhailovii]